MFPNGAAANPAKASPISRLKVATTPMTPEPEPATSPLADTAESFDRNRILRRALVGSGSARAGDLRGVDSPQHTDCLCASERPYWS